MGGRGTDVAREASAIVLLDDDFGAILKAVRLGRRIYDNLRKAMGYIMAVHFPIATLALLPLALGHPLILLPIHIAFLEMIIDPVCSLVFEAEGEERDVMRRPPRRPASALLSAPVLAWSLVQGLAAAGVVAAVYLSGHAQALPVPELRSLVFFTLCLLIVTLIFVNRSFSAAPLAAFLRPNPALVWVPLLVGGALALVLLAPPAAALFAFGPLHGHDLGLAFAAAGGMFLALELVKRALSRPLSR
jgi:Ca2+-transporting ATPase